MLIQLKPVQDSLPKPPAKSNTMAQPVLCEQPVPPPVKPRVRRAVWLAAGGAVTVAFTAEVYLYVHRPSSLEPARITANHFSRPVRKHGYNKPPKSEVSNVPVATPQVEIWANAQGTTPQVEIWTNVQVTAIIGNAKGHFFASVNQQLVKVGDTIDGMTVVGISAKSVTLSQGDEERDFPLGPGGN
jgi:hypothetical protein